MSPLEPRNPDYESVARRIFEQAPFVRLLGMTLTEVAPGSCRSALAMRPDLLQQDGFVHAGVQATLADHTGGTAAATLIAPGRRVLTVEFKINLLRAAQGRSLVCHARVLRPGRSVTVAESEVFCIGERGQILTAKALVTLAVGDQ